MVKYQLPDGRIVVIAYDVCRMASTMSFQLTNGSVVVAVICAGQVPE
jgi:hypothetical protein